MYAIYFDIILGTFTVHALFKCLLLTTDPGIILQGTGQHRPTMFQITKLYYYHVTMNIGICLRLLIEATGGWHYLDSIKL